MKVALGSAAWLLGCSVVLADPHEVLGTATCAREGHGGPCRVTWDFSKAPRTYYWVQRFDPTAKNWTNAEGIAINPYATSKEPVLGGFLYRVLACNDTAARKDCIGSTVHWVPLRPYNADDIPELVHSRSGTYQVSKNLPLWPQTYQYNVYLVTQLAENLDLTVLPPMTKPLEADPNQFQSDELTNDDLLHTAIYEVYEGKRQQQLAEKRKVAGTAP